MSNNTNLTTAFVALKMEIARRSDADLNRYATDRWSKDHPNWSDKEFWSEIRRKEHYVVK